MVRIHRHRGPWLAASFLVVLSACASGGQGGTRRGSGDTLTAAEMATWGALDLSVVIQRLRPKWLQVREALTTRGPVPMSIIVDGVRQEGSVEILRGFRASEVEEVRYVNARDATTRYGLDMMSGALVITTRRGAIRK